MNQPTPTDALAMMMLLVAILSVIFMVAAGIGNVVLWYWNRKDKA